MVKAALPSLAASLLLHLALSLGAGVQALRVSRAPLLPSRPTELELVPLDPAPLAAPAAGATEPPPVIERAPSRRSAALQAQPSAPPVPPAALPPATPASAAVASQSPSAVSPSAVSEVAAESAESAPSAAQAPSFSVAAASAAGSSAAPPGVAPQSSGTAGEADRALRAAYLQELRRRVLGHRVYPYLARRARLEGTVCLRVSLDGQGQVAQLQATCGAPAPLLEAAFSAVRTAAPFGPLPSQLGGALTVDIPVVFQLEAL